MKKQIENVEKFHKLFGHPISKTPIAEIPQGRKTLRYDLMKEENEEYMDAVSQNDIVGVADALGDMLYILCGTIIEHGLQDRMELIFDEIQRSNMSKLGEDGKPIFREDGKILKGPNYSKPDFKKILERKSLSLIAALSDNEVIAVDGKIPWKVPNDMKRFKELTTGHHIIMGRKTFETLPKLLPGRTHIVMTTNKEFHKLSEEGVVIVNNWQEALAACPVGEKSFVIGGGEIYEQSIDLVDEMELTIVNTIIQKEEGKEFTYFPKPQSILSKFYLESRVDNLKDEKNEFDYSFLTFKKIK